MDDDLTIQVCGFTLNVYRRIGGLGIRVLEPNKDSNDPDTACVDIYVTHDLKAVIE